MGAFINVADIVDPDDPQGRTYRQVNAARPHTIPVGSLVELESGVRLFVIHHGRDCDMEPLYYLSPDRDDTTEKRKGFRNDGWTGGYCEDSLTVVQESSQCS